MQASIQIQGPGTTPFDANNQNLVINAFASVMTTVTRADFLVRYFTSDDSKIPSFGTSGRKLLLEVNILLTVAFALQQNSGPLQMTVMAKMYNL